jgi:hypothetical protein
MNEILKIITLHILWVGISLKTWLLGFTAEIPVILWGMILFGLVSYMSASGFDPAVMHPAAIGL